MNPRRDCISVDAMTEAQVTDVVSTHLVAFKGFFLSSLGRRFLTAYYRSFVDNPDSIGLVAGSGQCGVAGFVVGAANPSHFYKRLLRRRWASFALAAVPAILRKPTVVGRVIFAFRHPSENPSGRHAVGLFSIGVNPAMQGRGVGDALIREFIAAAERRGGEIIFLTTDADNNAAVNRFYERHGFVRARSYFTREGRHMNEYQLTLARRSV